MTQEIDLEKYHQLALQKQKEHRKFLANLKKKPILEKVKNSTLKPLPNGSPTTGRIIRKSMIFGEQRVP